MSAAALNQPVSTSPAHGKMPHVLFIIDELVFPYGGAEEMLIRLVKHLPEKGYRVTVVTFRSDGSRDHEFGGVLRVLPLRKTIGLNALKVARRLWSLVRDEEVDLVQTFFNTSDLWAAPICRAAGCKAIVSSRRDMGILRSAKHRHAYRWLGKNFDKVLAVSEEVKTAMIRADHLPSSNVHVVYNGIELSPSIDRRMSRENLGLPSEAMVVSSVGHVRHVKGFDLLVRAAEQVLRKSPRVMFVIAGGELEPAYGENLKQAVKDSALTDHFVFAGPVYPPDPVYAASDIFCLPSRSEGMSHALLEAMSAGLPCVVTAVGGNPECVEDGISGLVVPPENPEALAAALLRLTEQPESRKTLGANARRRASEVFSVQAMVNSHANVYSELLSRGER